MYGLWEPQLLYFLISGFQDAEVPFGQSFQLGAKVYVSILFDKHLVHFF